MTINSYRSWNRAASRMSVAVLFTSNLASRLRRWVSTVRALRKSWSAISWLVRPWALFTHWSSGNTQLNGFALTPEYRRYLSGSGQALAGFYVAPFVRYQHLGLSAGAVDDAGTAYTAQAALHTIGGVVVVGHQWVYARRVTFDTFLGPSYNANVSRAQVSDGSHSARFEVGSFQGFSLRTGITLGVVF